MERSLKERLIIVVAQIPEEGLRLEEELPREWLTNIPEFCQEDGTHLSGPIRISGRISREGENLRLVGRVESVLATFCSRCGEPLDHPLGGEFNLLLVKGRVDELAEDVELTPEDLDRVFFDGITVDLAPFFQEEVALQVPIQVLCREDCRGLCPQCGANLNYEPCGCRAEEGDPRLAILRGLKIEK